MKKFIPLIFSAISAVIFSSCTTPAPSVTRVAKIETDQTTYSIAAFQDANSAKDKKDYPDAATIVQAAVESALFHQGKHIIKNGGDIEINGIVTAYYQGTFGGRYTTVGIDLNATDTKSGKLVWNTSLIKSTKYYFKYEPSIWAQEIANELVKEVFVSDNKQ